MLLFNTMADLSAHIDEIDHPNIKAMYDTFHANIEEADPIEAYTKHVRNIVHIHISENDRGVPGRGNIPWAETFAAIRKSGYDDWLTIEVVRPRAEGSRRRHKGLARFRREPGGRLSRRLQAHQERLEKSRSGSKGLSMTEAATMAAIDIGRLVTAVADTIAAHADELTALDQAIGDGDHGAQHEARLRGRARRACGDCGQAAARRAEGDRHQAGDDGRRRLRPAVRHAVPDARQGTAGRARPRRPCRGLRQGGRRGRRARQVAGRPEDHARRALSRRRRARRRQVGGRDRRRCRRGGRRDQAR